MQGEQVIVRAAEDELLVRKVWDSEPDLVYICDEEDYILLSALGEQPDFFPLGFPRRYVFKYDEQIAKKFSGKTHVAPDVWNKLSTWSGEEDQKTHA